MLCITEAKAKLKGGRVKGCFVLLVLAVEIACHVDLSIGSASNQ
jgi:hypothetical protein